MKTETEIYLEYETAIAQADSFARCAGDMKASLGDGLLEVTEGTASFWKGEGAALFSSRCRALYEDVSEKAENLLKVSETVRLIAGNIYEAEMRSLAIAGNSGTE